MKPDGLLERGDLVELGPSSPGPTFVVVYVNECRAVIQPTTPTRVVIGDRVFERPGAETSIAPRAYVRVVGRTRPPKDRTRLPRPMRRAHE